MKKLGIIGLLAIIILIIAIPYIIVYNIKDDPLKNLNLGRSPKIRVYLAESKKVIEKPLEEYLIGVVAAEMPAAFSPEALKAQAVAARTYTLYKLQNGGSVAHPKADICTDYRHCQDWNSFAEMKKKWGILGYAKNLNKIKKAVLETQGMVLTYGGQLIDPVYHASCGGAGTENSEEVWGRTVPYLRRVECNWDTKIQKESVEISLQKFSNIAFKGKDIRGEEIKIVKTSSGRVKYLTLGPYRVLAQDLRKQLGLKSTNFTWQVKMDKVIITTLGNGHAVGMCQYGANGLALAGFNYKKILKHYYPGVEIVNKE